MYDVIIFINGEQFKWNSDTELKKLNDYEVRRLVPAVKAGDILPISKSITVEPSLEIHLNKKD
jgi:hypothetical protein